MRDIDRETQAEREQPTELGGAIRMERDVPALCVQPGSTDAPPPAAGAEGPVRVPLPPLALLDARWDI